jgi:hypothetical protein
MTVLWGAFPVAEAVKTFQSVTRITHCDLGYGRTRCGFDPFQRFFVLAF